MTRQTADNHSKTIISVAVGERECRELVRLKVQIILCTYCLEEGRVEQSYRRSLGTLDGKGGGWCEGREGGSVLAVSAKRSEVVALRLVL